jgi:hypothetical protein
MASGLAMRMQLDLAHLMRRHRIAVETYAPLPPAVPSPTKVIEGYATIVGVADTERMSVAPLAWTPRRAADIPLLRGHDASRPVGKVLEATARPDGLWVRAQVDDIEARRLPAFSPCFTVHAYRIVAADDPVRFHALVTECSLDEITLTASPVLRQATWAIPSPLSTYYDLTGQAVQILIRRVELLQKYVREAPDAPPTPCRSVSTDTDRHTASLNSSRPRGEPRRATDFGRLVDQINARSQL